MINALLQILTLVILSTAMPAYVTPWFLIAVVPVVIVFLPDEEYNVIFFLDSYPCPDPSGAKFCQDLPCPMNTLIVCVSVLVWQS